MTAAPHEQLVATSERLALVADDAHVSFHISPFSALMLPQRNLSKP
jgi:hypothetical protein